MVKHREVAKAFADGKKATGSRMFTDGKTIYSFGFHFPIAHRLSNGDCLFNMDKYSSSTSRHQRYVECVLTGDIIHCNTREIRDAVDGVSPIIITRDKDVKEIDDALNILKGICIQKGMKRFPMRKLDDMLKGRLMADCL